MAHYYGLLGLSASILGADRTKLADDGDGCLAVSINLGAPFKGGLL